VLSDVDGPGFVFFVGSYRHNEVEPDHIMFGFIKMLTNFNVPYTNIRLDDLTESDVNSMISDTLGLFPRLCRSLSQVVFRKTNGNPFFVMVRTFSFNACHLCITLSSTSNIFSSDFPSLST
jgi:predicted ATPase